jgi:hypothetical protein
MCDPTTDKAKADEVDWLYTTLDNSLARAQTTDKKTDHFLGQRPLNLIFLVDTAQASATSPYTEFYNWAIKHFLEKLALSEQNLPEGDRTEFSIYPYQLRTYGSADGVTASENTPLTKDVAHDLLIQSSQVTENGNYKRGHLLTVARDRVIKEHPDPDEEPRTTALVVFSATSTQGDDPSHPELQGLDAFAKMPAGNWIGYDRHTRQGLNAEDAFIYVYGPKSITHSAPMAPITAKPVQPKTQTAAPTVVKPEPPPAPSTDTDTIVACVLLVAAAAAGGYFLYKWMHREYDISVGGSAARLNGNNQILIYGFGHPAEQGAIILGARDTLSYGPNLVATLKLKNEPILEPASGVQAFASASAEPSAVVVLSPGHSIDIKFKSGSNSTASIPFIATKAT